MREERGSGEKYSHYPGLCNLQRSSFVCVSLHSCSAMDQTDTQSLIGFREEFFICVCLCALTHACAHTTRLFTFHIHPLLHSYVCFSQHNTRADFFFTAPLL